MNWNCDFGEEIKDCARVLWAWKRMTHISIFLRGHFRFEQHLIQKSQQQQKIESYVGETGGQQRNRFKWFFRCSLLFAIDDGRPDTASIHRVTICADLSITLLKFLYTTKQNRNTKKELIFTSFIFIDTTIILQTMKNRYACDFRFRPNKRNEQIYFFARILFTNTHIPIRALFVYNDINSTHTIVVQKPLDFTLWPFAVCFSIPFWW